LAKAGSATSQDDTSAPLHFEVSTGLKRVIGRELITDPEVAIFELVKNSFDANATVVQLFIDDDRIVIVDNGDGMSYEDILNKWLVVAYSSKKESQRDYRDHISERPFAGSKGVGRFSSDRLGTFLTLQSRPKSNPKEPVHVVGVDWNRFEGNDKRDFIKVQLKYDKNSTFELPLRIKPIFHGTVLEITKLHEEWDRDRLKKLKASLAKLINPFGAKTDKFNLEIIAPLQEKSDETAVKKAKEKEPDLPPPPREVINGPVQNFIFSTLQDKTTFIEVVLSEDGKNFDSKLIDRGELVFHVREPNTHKELVGSDFRCQLFYLNQSAKLTFARRMGVPSVQFGNAFLFRNGFRIFPVGEDGDDWWGLNRRKQQGYARYLGTRELIGRVDVTGDEHTFQEASSRNQALLKTGASEALKIVFMEKCIKRLEAYVVPVSWPDKGDSLTSDLSRILTDAGRAKVSKAVATLVNSNDVELVEYSTKLIQIINERSENFEESIASLRSIASKGGDSSLMDKVDRAEKRFIELKKAEMEAAKEAEAERAARQKAEKKAEKAEREAKEAKEKYEEMRERNLFLTYVSSLDYDTVVNLHHQIILYASEAGALASNKIKEYNGKDTIDVEDVISTLEQTVFLNKKMLAVARFATKANFKLDSGEIEADIPQFLEQYIQEIGQEYLANRIRIEVDNQADKFIRRFKPIDFSIIIENLVSNAKKAKAPQITFELRQPKKNQLIMRIFDNGNGLGRGVKNPEDIFEKGFSLTRPKGSGLGLYHVRQVLEGMGGSISVDSEYTKKGTCFQVRFSE